jgi:hypothetical protein
MFHQSEEERRTDDVGKSEGCIVPVKPGNSGGGKACQAVVAIGIEHSLDTVPERGC